MRAIRRSALPAVDPVLAWLLAGLLIFGFVMLISASGPLGYERFGDTYWFVKHQLLFGFLPGTAAMLVGLFVPYRVWQRLAPSCLIASVVLLLSVFIPGLAADFGTAHSWIRLFGISLQPAEIVKLLFLIYLAAWFAQRAERDVQDVHTGLFPFLTSLGAVMLLIILQPDVGTMAVIVAIALAVYFMAGAATSHLFYLGGGGAALFFLLIRLAPYRAARFTTFLHPELDPQGVGYHINQALLAVGSGGWFGLGYGHSRQKFQYLPEVAGDSIFAVIAEELGFVLSAGIILLIVFFVSRLLRVAAAAKDPFARLFLVGLAAWVAFQAFVNIGAMLGLMPITGIPLPFVSYGGTSLVVLMGAMGIALNMSREARPS